MSDEGVRKARRAYRPEVEGLEVLRLLSSALASPLAVPAEFGAPDISDPTGTEPVWDTGADLGVDAHAWDVALDQSLSSELVSSVAREISSDAGVEEDVDSQVMLRGLSQLDRYLSRSWARAGLPSQKHDDCSQAVYLTLLQHLGRIGFDRLVTEVGRLGIREVLSRETAEGPDFFRAIDATKKRAQRERSHQSLDDGSVAVLVASRDDHRTDALGEAIDHALSPREAALIRATMAGETPAEIADRWGVAPKTVSNEKTRAFQKLRDFLLDPPDRSDA